MAVPHRVTGWAVLCYARAAVLMYVITVCTGVYVPITLVIGLRQHVHLNPQKTLFFKQVLTSNSIEFLPSPL